MIQGRRLLADRGPRRYTLTYTVRRSRFYPASWPFGTVHDEWEKVCTSDEAYGMLAQLDALGLDCARLTSEPL